MNLDLSYEGFENYLVEKSPLFDGIQYKFRFENDYGASVTKHRNSYGHEKDLWELGVLRWFVDDTSHLAYNTKITDDIKEYLTDKDVRDVLERIKNL